MSQKSFLQSFSDDSPKTNPWEEDRLGYLPFAKQLSNVVLRMDAPNGYVIGLHGAWGSGKSTALNFVKAFIEKHNVERGDDAKPLQIIDFKPWIVSGHRTLLPRFLRS
jgi:predicted KAP-like P-loop ATPase